LYIGNDIVTSLQVDPESSAAAENTESTEEQAAENRAITDAGFAPLSPETPYWGPPAGTDTSDPGFAPISPETPSWGPPAGTDTSDPGFAPISPETPSWGPPAGSGSNSGSGSGSGTCTGCPGNNWTISPIVVIPGQSSQDLSNVRFLHAAAGQPPVNIRLGNRIVINRMQFGNSTPYYLQNAGYQTVLVTNANTGAILYSSIFYFNTQTAYTFALVNSGSGISLMQLVDTPCTNKNAACIRAVNLSPNSGPVDVFLSGAGRVFQNIDTFGVTNYRTVGQGSYRAFVSEALPCVSGSPIIMAGTYVECSNTRIAIMDSTNVNFMNGVSYTLYLIGYSNAAQLIALESDLIY